MRSIGLRASQMHRYATAYKAKDAGITIVADLLGHENHNTHGYAMVSNERARRAVDLTS